MAEEQTTNEGPDGADFRRQLEEANARAAKAERDSALFAAGLDPESAKARMVIGAVEGDITPDSVKSALTAVEAEFGGRTQAEPTEEPTEPAAAEQPNPADDESIRQSVSRGQAAGQVAAEPPPEPPSEDPVDAAYAQRQELRNEGVRNEDAAAPVFHTIIQGAANGDERFLVD